MSFRTVPEKQTCLICIAKDRLEVYPGESYDRIAEAWMLGYVAALVHGFDARSDAEVLAKRSLDGACSLHAVQLNAHVRRALDVFMREHR